MRAIFLLGLVHAATAMRLKEQDDELRANFLHDDDALEKADAIIARMAEMDQENEKVWAAQHKRAQPGFAGSVLGTNTGASGVYTSDVDDGSDDANPMAQVREFVWGIQNMNTNLECSCPFVFALSAAQQSKTTGSWIFGSSTRDEKYEVVEEGGKKVRRVRDAGALGHVVEGANGGDKVLKKCQNTGNKRDVENWQAKAAEIMDESFAKTAELYKKQKAKLRDDVPQSRFTPPGMGPEWVFKMARIVVLAQNEYYKSPDYNIQKKIGTARFNNKPAVKDLIKLGTIDP